MRIKFEKGMTPERMAKAFVDFIRSNEHVIGTVNMYIQTYDEEMKVEDYKRDGRYFVCSPSDEAIAEYNEDVVSMRRKRIKAV